MKNFLLLLILSIGLLVMPPGIVAEASILPSANEFVVDNTDLAPAATAQEEGGVAVEAAETNQVINETATNFLKENWLALSLGLLAFIELIVRLTPTQKDNSIFNLLTMLINALLPNIKKGGGSFKLLSK